ncbi:MAG: hypothetical protein ACXWLR_09785 [Myxococcales bacterium]
MVELEVHRQGADVRVIARTMALPRMNAVLMPDHLVSSGGREHGARESGRGQRKGTPELFSC